MSECRRSVLSCARCRRRKIKCDRAIPCGQCVTAKTACTGYSSKDQDPNIPRSIVQHLESELAKIEAELASNGHLEDLNASDILVGMPTTTTGLHIDTSQPPPNQLPPILSPITRRDSHRHSISALTEPSPVTPVAHRERDAVRDEAMKSDEIQAMIFAILPSGPGITDLVARIRMSLTPSKAMTTESPRGIRRKSVSRSQTEVTCAILHSIPPNIVRSLIKKYMSKVYPIFPILYAPALWQQLDTVLSTLQALPDRYLRSVPPSYDFLIIYLMLAVSATLGSSKTGHEAKHMMFSGSLFEEGIQHLSANSKIPSDLAGIQVTLLILQYASINPRLANVWMLTGAAMRACLELGLHREAPDALAFDKVTLDLRRRIFWSAYMFDRSICSALQRPVSIPDQTIDAHFPSILDDRHIHPTSVDSTGTQTKIHMLRWCHFRRLQSVMTEVHFQGKPLDPGQTWEDWLMLMESRLQAWSEDYNNGHELTEFTLAHGLTNLHRPSPRMPMPSPRSLMVAFEAACQSAKSLREHILSGFYRRSWLIAHHVLENSMVVLFCLRHGFDTISARFEASEIFEMTKVFTANFLSLAAQGWNEVSNYAGVYERLLGPLLESVFSGRSPSLTSFGPAQDSELTRLLYPGTAQLDKLRFGRTYSNEDLPSFDMASINWEDFSVSDGPQTGEFVGGWDLLESVNLPQQDAVFGMA
ncbi:Pyrimidine pathway regulatory protein 1 [Cyphellophora attinorum]|uniref:Pyrimidine pathway regulatory protein 1 n=1 Tax=Cyphellophora attinorum TaxID=1664694 RepID=A0A0N0NQG7_9EURO|nr:Pyrimidine pathway regulatory protein 1 [Phialophora attinorum]KPI43888.1 Pyrimidine pathway regulatory protein 1 [Phialophora attinorum]